MNAEALIGSVRNYQTVVTANTEIKNMVWQETKQNMTATVKQFKKFCIVLNLEGAGLKTLFNIPNFSSTNGNIK